MMLAEIYEVDGKKNHTYGGAVTTILGRTHGIILATVLYLEMWLSAVSYTLAAGTSMQFIAETSCKWQGKDSCFSSTWVMMVS